MPSETSRRTDGLTERSGSDRVRMSRNAVSRERERPRVDEERSAGAREPDEHAADGRPDEPYAQRAYELVERVRLEQQVVRDDVADDAR